MNCCGRVSVLLCIGAGVCLAARCTTIADPAVLRAYETYVATTETAMPARFDAGELSWIPPASAKAAARKLASGGCVRQNLSDESFNRGIADRNGTIVHWIGGIRIPGTSLAELRAVVADFENYPRFYRPMVFEARLEGTQEPSGANELTLGLCSVFRFASLFPQHYAFQAQTNVEFDHCCDGSSSVLRLHLRANGIRESDSGVPGRNDLLPAYQDHGIMWGLNAYWRAREVGSQLYLEFETITLARSVQSFACRIGGVPIPKSVIASAMDSLPSESVTVILEGTKVECQRRSTFKQGGVAAR